MRNIFKYVEKHSLIELLIKTCPLVRDKVLQHLK